MSPIPAELIALMLDEITLELVASGPDKFNNFTFSSPVTVKCQFVRKNKIARDRSGREVVSTAQMILADPTLPVTVYAKLTLADGSSPAIIEVLAINDDVGPYVLEIMA